MRVCDAVLGSACEAQCALDVRHSLSQEAFKTFCFLFIGPSCVYHDLSTHPCAEIVPAVGHPEVVLKRSLAGGLAYKVANGTVLQVLSVEGDNFQVKPADGLQEPAWVKRGNLSFPVVCSTLGCVKRPWNGKSCDY